MQDDLLAACNESYIYWLNAFGWTYHQFDVDPITGDKIDAEYPHNPFITWEIQDELLMELNWHAEHGKDIMINKSRDMGASWICLSYIHWEWLFKEEKQILEMSRTKDYVDKTGNMKALFQKHDYINQWLPWWMLPPECLPGEKHRTGMHMRNDLNGSTIDGESTTEHAASGDRRRIILLDEFAKVKHGKAMRNATRDAALCRIINSTVAGPGTEYSKMKQEGKIKVFALMYWDHPEKGAGRYVKQDPVTKKWEIRSPWFDREEAERSPTELAQEVLAQDVESGSLFFDPYTIETHLALFGQEPKHRFDIKMKFGIADDVVRDLIRSNKEFYFIKPDPRGSLRVWVDLIDGRLDQNLTYTIGGDISKGHGASNSVLSVVCNETGEKVAEWRDANTPPFEMARVAVALARWVGGRVPYHRPFLVWEKNGPGLDFGRQIVVKFGYPRYYKTVKKAGESMEVDGTKYGWHSNRDSKELLLRNYERALAHGGIYNHCKWGLLEAKQYVYYDDGGVGPAELMEENAKARETHGDVVIADALALLGAKKKRAVSTASPTSKNSMGLREQLRKRVEKKVKGTRWRQQFDHR